MERINEMSNESMLGDFDYKKIAEEMEKVDKESDSMRFRNELQYVLNTYSKENESNTPDFLLADFVIDCLKAFNKAVNSRKKYLKED
jgi:hypothetical protein